MMHPILPASSWLAAVQALPLVGPDRTAHPRSVLLVWRTTQGQAYVSLAPTWLPGLIVAAHRRGSSVGRLVSRYRYRGMTQKITGARRLPS